MSIQEIIEKFAEYKRAFQAFFLTLLILLFGVSFFYSRKIDKTENKYVALSRDMDAFISKGDFDEGIYASISSFLHSHPESLPGNEQRLSQHLFSLGEKQKGTTIAKRAIKRMQTHVPYYREYASVSLLIEGGLYEEALKDAIGLEEKLRSDEQLWNQEHTQMIQSDHLMASTLFRVAMLQKELGQHSQELKTLTALKEFLGLSSGKGPSSTAKKQTAKAFLSEFQAGSLSLVDYINQRERVIH